MVIGGGLLGLEAANALKRLGLQTHVVEFAPQLMAVQVDAGGGRLLKDKIEQLGVQVHTSKATQGIKDGSECRYKLCFKRWRRVRDRFNSCSLPVFDPTTI